MGNSLNAPYLSGDIVETLNPTLLLQPVDQLVSVCRLLNQRVRAQVKGPVKF